MSDFWNDVGAGAERGLAAYGAYTAARQIIDSVSGGGAAPVADSAGNSAGFGSATARTGLPQENFFMTPLGIIIIIVAALFVLNQLK